MEVAAGAGMPHEEIALLLVPPLSVDELKDQYATELEMGPAKANLEISTGLLKAARAGHVTAMIYWTKSRMGWAEKESKTKDGPLEREPGAPAALVPAPAVGLFRGKLKLVKK